MGKKWTKSIEDDPVKASNQAGTITYAATGQPNSRTTQVFVNYKDNSRLDRMGFAPFGKVTSGMDVLAKINNPTPGSSGGVSQGGYEGQGQAWIKKEYPHINSIISAKVESVVV